MDETLPGNKRLICTWLLLMGLTMLSMGSAQLGGDTQWSSLPLWGIAVVLVSTAYKVRQILMVYLNLRVSSGGWKGGFMCLLAATLLLVFAAYIAAPLN